MRIGYFNLRGGIILFYIITSVSFVVTLAMLFKEYLKYEKENYRPKRANMSETDHHKLQPMPRIFNTVFKNQENLRSLRCPKDHLKDILLVVALSTTYAYESIPLFELLYKGGFRNRVFCGPSLLANSSNISIHVVNTRNGAFLYDCLSSIVEKYTDYNGYLFIAEEVLLNYWNLLLYDKNRIWQDIDVINGPALYSGTPDSWEWWASPWGMRALEKAFEYLVERSYSDLRKSKLTEGDWKPEWDVSNALNAWLWNGEGVYKSYWVNKSALYLPRRHLHDYKKLARIFRQSGVRHALAMPTIARLLELEVDTVKLKGTSISDVKASNISNDREALIAASKNKDFLFIKGGTKERRETLNDLKIKEFAVGKFLYYDECPD
ncbi:uncharacterized protein LOC135684178 isoform X2 [Rhopilema esculentum]|uniref:uncharacterized protein LOC135684178 isoform X2 n=1 Tax=Rhopilema esculentum TaxID=499914 RepID=UPI0031DE9C38